MPSHQDHITGVSNWDYFQEITTAITNQNVVSPPSGCRIIIEGWSICAITPVGGSGTASVTLRFDKAEDGTAGTENVKKLNWDSIPEPEAIVDNVSRCKISGAIGANLDIVTAGDVSGSAPVTLTLWGRFSSIQ